MKKFIKRNKMNITLAIISLVAIIIGTLAIGLVKALIIVGIIDILLFIPPIFMEKKQKKKKNTTKKTKNSTNEEPKTKTKKKKKKKKIWKYLLMLCFLLGIVLIIGAGLFIGMIVKEAPDFDPDKLSKQEATIIYDKAGDIIAKIGAQKREKITYDEMPEVLVDAIVATEDSRFFQHNGFDLPRFLKASAGQLLGNSDAGGASTLTMQVVKNNYTSTVSSGFEGIKRKFTDIYMSIFKIEKTYTKQEILEFYVNDNYLGGGAWGVEQACLNYFGKHTKDINLAEAAMIAGLFNAPVAYDPYINPELTEQRRQTVLSLMKRHGYITEEERKAAAEITVEKMVQKSAASDNEYQGFINTVVAEVQNLTGNDPYSVSMEIYTTMEKDKQDHINKVLSGEIFTWENEVVDTGIAVIDVDTGALAAVGVGRNFNAEKDWNNATMMKKQIGSTAKPLYDYGPAIEYNNFSTAKLYGDEPYNYSNGGEINNWDGSYNGTLSMRMALAQSRNVPAIKAFQSVSNKNINTFVTNLGLSPELEDGIVHEAHSIGAYNGESPVTMASAYNAFANGGYYSRAYSFTKLIYRETGEVYENKTQKTRAMSEETAYMITDMLKTTTTYALGQYYGNLNGVKFAAKTGTTNFDEITFETWNLPYGAINDLWVVGYDTDYTISVWYGYDKINPNYVSKIGTVQHSKLFHTVASGILTSTKDFTKPNGVVEITVEKDCVTPSLPSEFTPEDMKITELFKKGTEPTEVSNRYAKLEDVTDLKSKINKNKVELTWTKINTPSAIDHDSIKKDFQKIYKDEATVNQKVNERIYYNQSYIGEIGYEIYEKTSNGTLKLIEFTKENSIKVTPSKSGKTTYVVKSAYSIFKANMSDGKEITVEFEKEKDNNDDKEDKNDKEPNNNDNTNTETGTISADLIGDKAENIAVNTPIDTSASANVTVMEGTKNVTSNATIEITITDYMTNTKVNSIDNTKTGTYGVEYKIKYKDYEETLTKTIVIY